MKKIKVLFSLFLAVTVIFNQYHVAKAAPNGYSSNYITGGFNKAVGIQIKCVYGVQALTDIAKNQWNGVSSKVKLVTTYSDNVIETYFDVYDRPQQSVNGTTIRYNGSKQLPDGDSTSRWTKAKCYQYKAAKSQKALLENQKRKTATHELGHALSMAHPYGGTNTQNGPDAFMKSGEQSIYNLYKFDKDSLKGRWGS